MTNSSSTPPAQADTPADLPLRSSEEIQGNILAGFLKDHQVFLFLQFADGASGRAWLAELAPRIATTKQVATFNAQFSLARRNQGGDDPQSLKAVWVNVSFTRPGLIKLGPALDPDLQAFPAFREGPAARADAMRDQGLSAPGRWLVGGSGQQPADAMLTIAADDEGDLAVQLDKQRALLAQHRVAIVFEQRGDTLPDERAGHEHFGFKDGISQPGVRGFHPTNPANPSEQDGHPGTEMIAAGEFVLGQPREDGFTQTSPAWMQDGSFQVFRRLAQDVPGWWAQVIACAQSLPASDGLTADQLAAKLVGRWRSGTPLAHAPERDNRPAQDPADDNDFRYDDDPQGQKTPRFAHIRKVYPRSRALGDQSRRILRRGIPFGAPFDPAAGRGHGVDADRGLLFNAFMAGIEEQFEFLQQTWANSASFQSEGDGPDPVIGDDPGTNRLHRAGRPDRDLDFRRFVHTTGALYAFAPSLTAIRRLAGGEFVQPPALRVGGRAEVSGTGGDPLRMRDQPGLGGKIQALLPPGTQMTLLEGPRPADGHNWWRARTTDGRAGWVAGTFLRAIF
ncbi:MAG: Dyp-type peroxidase [Kouleothrix sp.]|nr:Dyp-type peroxidase [Kouleothrix sp.]